MFNGVEIDIVTWDMHFIKCVGTPILDLDLEEEVECIKFQCFVRFRVSPSTFGAWGTPKLIGLEY